MDHDSRLLLKTPAGLQLMTPTGHSVRRWRGPNARPIMVAFQFAAELMTRLLKLPSLVTCAMVAALSGCSVNATMIPVEGPLSQMRPPPVLNVRVNGVQGSTGALSFQMPDGESCQGRWASAAGSGVSVGQASLLSQYGSTYITCFSISPGRRQNPGQALATCQRGRTLQLEFVTGAGTAHGYGIGKDNEGNVYRFVF